MGRFRIRRTEAPPSEPGCSGDPGSMRAQVVDSPDLLSIANPHNMQHHQQQVMSPSPCSPQQHTSISNEQQQQQQQQATAAVLLRQLTEFRLPAETLERMYATGISVEQYHGTLEVLQRGLDYLAMQLHERTNILGENLQAQAGRSEILVQMMQQVDLQFRAKQQWEQAFQQAVYQDTSHWMKQIEETITSLKSITIAEVCAKQTAMQTSLSEISRQVEKIRGVEHLHAQFQELQRSFEEKTLLYQQVHEAVSVSGQAVPAVLMDAMEKQSSSLQDLAHRHDAMKSRQDAVHEQVAALERRLLEQDAEIVRLRQALENQQSQQKQSNQGSPLSSAAACASQGHEHYVLSPDAGTPTFGGYSRASQKDGESEWWDWHGDQPPGLTRPLNPPSLPEHVKKATSSLSDAFRPLYGAALGVDLGKRGSVEKESDQVIDNGDVQWGEGPDRSRIPEGRWKMLRDLPSLTLPGGAAWEIGVYFQSWKAQCRTIFFGISAEFASYVQKCWDKADELYADKSQRLINPVAPQTHADDHDFEARLSAALMRILPDEVKLPVVEGTASGLVSSVMLFVGVLGRLQPAGPEEATSLLQFVRSPPTAQTAQELDTLLRRYRLALRRLSQLGMPDIAPTELLRAAQNMTKQLERKYNSFQMRLNLLRLFPETSSRPTAEGVEKYLATAESQVLELVADEASRAAKPTGQAEVHQASSSSGATPSQRKCYFYGTEQGCRRGKECPFIHDDKDKGKGKGKGKDKGKKGKETSQVAQSQTQQKPDPKAKPEPKAKAEPKPKPKANPKAKASAQKLLGVDEGGAQVNTVRVRERQQQQQQHADMSGSCSNLMHDEVPDSELNPHRTHVEFAVSGGRGRLQWIVRPSYCMLTVQEALDLIAGNLSVDSLELDWQDFRAPQRGEIGHDIQLAIWANRNHIAIVQDIWDDTEILGTAYAVETVEHRYLVVVYTSRRDNDQRYGVIFSERQEVKWRRQQLDAEVWPPIVAKATAGGEASQLEGFIPEWVLLDSGANEICRPLDPAIDYANAKQYIPLDVTLASGRAATGYRSVKDGEISMQMEGHDWIAGLSRLVDAGYFRVDSVRPKAH